MKEEFLHFVWMYELFNKQDLHTTSGDEIEIVHPGQHNSDAGPDFFNAKVKIDGTLWVGNVEIHIFSSDWQKHGHDKNKAYDNVILHVVFKDDRVVTRSSGDPIPAMELAFRERLYENGEYLSYFEHDISRIHSLILIFLTRYSIHNTLYDKLITN